MYCVVHVGSGYRSDALVSGENCRILLTSGVLYVFTDNHVYSQD